LVLSLCCLVLDSNLFSISGEMAGEPPPPDSSAAAGQQRRRLWPSTAAAFSWH
jgi:hypothetical protein